MILRTGVDLIEVERVRAAIQRHGQQFLQRIYTPQELDEVGKNEISLAARFAAKEAVAKALGTGIGKISFQDIEILRGDLGEPVLHLHHAAAELADSLGLDTWSISLSHTQEHAVAMVVALGNPHA
ncbi:MAG: holo-ACP synthase [Anaerolineales bacterium]|jgi:holo-[acyl-carrier protein] synthase|nr:holo-ACP synthase [Anaerolineales bacterium]